LNTFCDVTFGVRRHAAERNISDHLCAAQQHTKISDWFLTLTD